MKISTLRRFNFYTENFFHVKNCLNNLCKNDDHFILERIQWADDCVLTSVSWDIVATRLGCAEIVKFAKCAKESILESRWKLTKLPIWAWCTIFETPYSKNSQAKQTMCESHTQKVLINADLKKTALTLRDRGLESLRPIILYTRWVRRHWDAFASIMVATSNDRLLVPGE